MPNVSATAPPPSDETCKGILLLEEYDALAVAIASALKKFAPHHAVRLARTLAEAEAAAEEMHPELFVLDLDPPPSGQVEFFDKLQHRFPEARVLVIAAGTSPELRAERGTAGAVQFIEKPFDLGEFGAAVQALLGPWSAPTPARERGTLRDLQVVDIVQLKCLALSTAVVSLETADGRVGEIHFHAGEICHAATGELHGVVALEEIMGWPGGRLSETEVPADAPKTIDSPWAILLLRAVRKTTENGTSQAQNPPPAPPAEPLGKTVLVIDDTEMLLIFAADVLSTADSSYNIVTAPSGREGLRVAAALRPDLILLDYSLMDINGAEVCHGLLENEATAQIPILMMSGHLPELANTAAKYGNVVATLPKPFLSGALIQAVEKILAAGPLPEAPVTPLLVAAGSVPDTPIAPSLAATMPLPVALPAPPPEAPISSPVPVLPNGNGNGHSEASAPPVAIVSELKEVSVTFLLEVLSMQLTPDFRMGALQLKPAGGSVGVRVADGGERGMRVEKGFQMGPAQLSADGRIGTILLVPKIETPLLAAAGNSFAVHGVRARPVAQSHVVEMMAASTESMRVHLTAEFELLRVEFSPTFEVTAVVLRARESVVQVGLEGDLAAAPFELAQAQLDDTGRPNQFVVRAKR